MTGRSDICLARTMSLPPSPTSEIDCAPVELEAVTLADMEVDTEEDVEVDAEVAEEEDVEVEPEIETEEEAEEEVEAEAEAEEEDEETICFRLPTAVVTRAEMRKHVLAEVVLWLTGPVLTAAKAVAPEEEEDESGPVGQLFLIVGALRSTLPTDRGDALGAAAAITAETCQRFLLDSDATSANPVEDLMMDYVDEITVDGEQTLQDLWNYSPFDALREAPPLNDEDYDGEEAEALVPNSLIQFLQTPLAFHVPVGALVAVIIVVVAYLFLVAVVTYKKH